MSRYSSKEVKNYNTEKSDITDLKAFDTTTSPNYNTEKTQVIPSPDFDSDKSSAFRVEERCDLSGILEEIRTTVYNWVNEL